MTDRMPLPSLMASEYKQFVWLRWVNVAFMVAIGIGLSHPYQEAKYKIAQQLLYLTSAAAFFFICYLKLRMWTSKSANGPAPRLRSWSNDYLLTTIAVVLMFALLAETWGWYDQYIGRVVSFIPSLPSYLVEVLSFLIVAAIGGVVGNYSYHRLTRALDSRGGKNGRTK